MDHFWIFLLIFGAIVSIGQKAGKQQAPDTTEGEPVLTPEEEMERRIRELLEGRPTTAKPAPQPTPAPSPATVTPTSGRAKKSNTTHIVSRILPNSKAKPGIVAPIASVNNLAATNPIKQTEIKRSEIGKMMKDFTIDKAVIYSEIINPKFKEY